MATMMSTTAGDRVNRRFLFLALILGALSAILVYVGMSRSGEEIITSAGVSVVVAKEPITAGTTITGEMLELREVPLNAAALGYLGSMDAAIGRVTRFPIAANGQVLLSSFIGSATIGPGTLSGVLAEGTVGMAITTQAVIGAGGLVLPGDHVDILWLPEVVLADHEGAMLIAENVEVIAIAQITVDIPASGTGATEGAAAVDDQATTDDRTRSSDAEANPDARTVTLMVTLEQAQQIFCAEQSGVVRMAVRPFGDTTATGIPPATCVLLAEEE